MNKPIVYHVIVLPLQYVRKNLGFIGANARKRNSAIACHPSTESICHGKGLMPSHRTFHLPSCGNPGLGLVLPSHPAHIMATAIRSPPFPGR